jgi:hypothetical protein
MASWSSHPLPMKSGQLLESRASSSLSSSLGPFQSQLKERANSLCLAGSICTVLARFPKSFCSQSSFGAISMCGGRMGDNCLDTAGELLGRPVGGNQMKREGGKLSQQQIQEGNMQEPSGNTILAAHQFFLAAQQSALDRCSRELFFCSRECFFAPGSRFLPCSTFFGSDNLVCYPQIIQPSGHMQEICSACQTTGSTECSGDTILT